VIAGGAGAIIGGLVGGIILGVFQDGFTLQDINAFTFDIVIGLKSASTCPRSSARSIRKRASFCSTSRSRRWGRARPG
jgi:hypothetical protein